MQLCSPFKPQSGSVCGSRDFAQFRRVAALLASRGPAKVHPRRSASSYLLSGLVKCRRFEGLIVAQIRDSILTERNIRALVRLVEEELDGVAHEQRRKLAGIETELAEVRRRLDRVWHVIETSDLDLADATARIKAHQPRQERLERAAAATRALLAERRAVLDDVETITAFAQDRRVFLQESDRTESKAFIRSFVQEIAVAPGAATIRYAIPLPEERQIRGPDTAAEALQTPVLSTVPSGGPGGIRTPDLLNAIQSRSQLRHRPVQGQV